MRALNLVANLNHTERTRARSLRKAETEAERLLWEFLRGRRLGGFKFVRQLPVGPYIADFACREMKLIVEIDGATHGSPAELAHDAKRYAFLMQQGWRVQRFGNEEVFKNRSGVCDTILLLLRRRD